MSVADPDLRPRRSAAYAVLSVLRAAGGPWLMALLACGVVASYTHFFGLVVCGGALLAALRAGPGEGKAGWPVLSAIAASLAVARREPVGALRQIPGGGPDRRRLLRHLGRERRRTSIAAADKR